MEALVPVIPGAVAVTCLALARVNVSPRGGDRTRAYWTLLNLGLFIWSSSYFLGNALVGWTTVEATQVSARLLFGVGQFGVALTITNYYLFSAELAGLRRFARGPSLIAAYAPGVILVLSCIFPPLTDVFVTWGTGDQAHTFSYGPLGTAIFVALYGLVLAGAMLHLGAHHERRGCDAALPHRAFAAAGILPLVANVFWMGRGFLGLTLSFNPTILAFLAANAIMLGALRAWCRATPGCSDGLDVVIAEDVDPTPAG